jgi:hypothetical protein
MDQNTSDSLFGLRVDSEAVIQFREGAKWARFISIVYLVGILIVALVVTFAGASVKSWLEMYVPSMGTVDMDMLGNIFVVVVIIILAIVGFIYILLYRFANLVRKGIMERNQEVFNDGLKYLKYYCIINGVIALLGILFSFIGTIAELLK